MATVHDEPGDKFRRLARVRNLAAMESVRPAMAPELVLAHAIADRITLGLMMSGILVLMLHAWQFGNIGPIAQIVGVVLLLAAGALAWASGSRSAAPGPVELCLFATGSLSLITLFLNSEISPTTARTSLAVTIILMLAVVLNAALIRRISIERLLDASAAAFALATIPILLFESEGIVGALTAGDQRWAWLFRPFDLHHSLTSIIFSLGVLLSVYQIIVGRLVIKAAFTLALIAQVVIILASGGRTGVVACSISLFLVFLTRMRNTPAIVWVGVVALGAGAIFYFEQLYAFVATMMEFDSKYRGFGTGATGRTEIWSQGIELILADPIRLVFGSGLRTAGVEEIGYNPENSYIAITLESGAIMCLWLVAALLATIARLHYHASDPDKDSRLILYGILPVIQYALLVGVFNRQMLAVGNPASMIFIIVFAAAWIYVSEPGTGKATAAPAPRNAPSDGEASNNGPSPRERRAAKAMQLRG